MNKFNWQDDYNIDCAVIDQQHQKMFDLANQVFAADNQQAVIKLTMELFQHIREHFKAEEALMKEKQYP